MRRPVAVAFAALALIGAGLLLAACGDDDGGTTTESTSSETTTTETTATEEPTVVRITVVDGEPEGGIVRESVDQGDQVVLEVTSDVADEIHVHGYDESREVAAGDTVRVAFEATIPGRFEVELEERGVQIAELTVQP